MSPRSLANLKRGDPPNRKGIPNKFTADMRTAALIAATAGEEGDDDAERLASFYKCMKRERPDNFDRALERLLPRDMKLDATVRGTLADLVEAAALAKPKETPDA